MKKSLFLVALAFVTFGCDESNKVVPYASCGDGVVDTAQGEVCDTASAESLSCSAFDASKTWAAGGNAACAADCGSITRGTCTELTDPEQDEVCGDGKITGSEVCDTAATESLACTTFDNTKSWNGGGNAACSADCRRIEQGTCEEVVCGDGKVSGSEVCDTNAGDTIACSQFDGTKSWTADGKAACSADCKSFARGTCEEVVCGDGKKTGSEVCDSETFACARFDANKNWLPGGLASCAQDCTKIEQGTCIEDTTPAEGCSQNDQCAAPTRVCDTQNSKCVQCLSNDDCNGEAPICDTNTKICVGCLENKDCTGDKSVCNTETNVCIECTKDADCGENSVCNTNANVCVGCLTNENCGENSVCDQEKGACVGCLSNKDCSGETPLCDTESSQCVADSPSETCARSVPQGIYWCQVIDTTATINETTKSQSITAKFRAGSDVDVKNLKAEFVYQDQSVANALTNMSSWKSGEATITSAADEPHVATFNLTEDLLSSALTNSKNAHFTFRISGDNGTNWQYCKVNHANGNDLNCDLTTFEAGKGQADDLGKAVYNAVKTVATFNFNKDSGLTKLSDGILGTGGNASLNGSATCSQTGCYVTDSDGQTVLSLTGWLSGNYASSGNDKGGNIVINAILGNDKSKLTFKVLRKSDSSPKRLYINFDRHDGAGFFYSRNVDLNTTTNVYQSITIEFPTGRANKNTGVSISADQGSDALQFKDFVITSNN